MFVIGANGSSVYNLTRSLRFRRSASANLSRTFGSGGNRQIFTFSLWLKRGALSSSQFQFIGVDAGGSNEFVIKFEAADTLTIYDYQSAYNINLVTTQVFRDPSAWYHIVVAVDTTQATAANRVKLYVNGTQITAFSTATYPSQNYNTMVNYTVGTFYRIGVLSSSLNYFDGYLAEVNFINGQALTPSSFGSTSATTGVWQPAQYTGTYGTNGFYLPFTDNSALTTASNAGLGKDFSGNANYWVTNNISLTAGTTYDSMTDVPTLTSATAANFAVLNPLEHPTTFIAPTNANLTQNCNTSAWTLCVPTINIPNSSGLWQWEFVQTGTANGANAFGVCLSTVSATTTGDPSSRAGCSGVSNASGAFINGSTSGSITYPTTGTTVTCLYDATNLTLQVFQDGTSRGTITGLPSGDVRPFVAASSSNGSPTFDINFGQRPFGYDQGGKSLNTYNLSTSTIVKGNTVMDATLYTGNSSTQTVTNAGAFKPDLVWIKDRSSVAQHVWTDSVRGVDRQLFSSLTNAEQTSTGGITSLNSNGFSLGVNVSPTGNTNGSPDNFVAWQWQAGQGTTSSDTSGSITSTVSVNASAGFSIVSYTGTGSNATVGHGLGVAPQVIICKNRSAAGTYWHSYFAAISGMQNGYIVLNTTAAFYTPNTTVWNGVQPTSTVFSIGTDSGVNGSGNAQIAYCWTPIAGYSSFGSYTGNGSTDGPFVYTGFRPKFVLIKMTSSTGDWYLYDSSRDPYNATQQGLSPNSSASETTYTGWGDLLSNGFKIRRTDAAWNSSGGTYIYMAFAENPLKNALAR